MVKTAVILAAGLGSRLKDKTELQPKGFLELEGKSLIQRSIDNLLNAGIEDIYLGTGYLSSVYEEFAQNYPQIICIKSDKFRSTSSMYTLYNMRDQIKGDFLLLESDLLYDTDALEHLISCQEEDAILASGKTDSNDEVYIEADEQNHLVAMSKKLDDIDKVYGELVGISKVSASRYNSMCKAFEELSNPKIDYEYIMVETSKRNPYFVKKVEDLVWCEIDDDDHLHRALNKILPRIKVR